MTAFPARKAGEHGAWVFCGGKCANKELVAAGLARVQPRVAKLEPNLVQTQLAAKGAKRGIWAKN